MEDIDRVCLGNANDPEITLRDVTVDNWLEVIELEISKEQERFVATSSDALAASKFYEYYVNRAVYRGDICVGFIQYYPNIRENKPEEIFIDQLLVDHALQGQGIGTRAIAILLEEIKTLESYATVSVCYVEGHDIMRGFFERFGFSVVEQDEFDETVMRLAIVR